MSIKKKKLKKIKIKRKSFPTFLLFLFQIPERILQEHLYPMKLSEEEWRTVAIKIFVSNETHEKLRKHTFSELRSKVCQQKINNNNSDGLFEKKRGKVQGNWCRKRQLKTRSFCKWQFLLNLTKSQTREALAKRHAGWRTVEWTPHPVSEKVRVCASPR